MSFTWRFIINHLLGSVPSTLNPLYFLVPSTFAFHLHPPGIVSRPPGSSSHPAPATFASIRRSFHGLGGTNSGGSRRRVWGCLGVFLDLQKATKGNDVKDMSRNCLSSPKSSIFQGTGSFFQVHWPSTELEPRSPTPRSKTSARHPPNPLRTSMLARTMRSLPGGRRIRSRRECTSPGRCGWWGVVRIQRDVHQLTQTLQNICHYERISWGVLGVNSARLQRIWTR